MGFRFHRSIRLLPGVRLNLSKSGVSASVGTRGAWFTLGAKGARTTVGIPGTGISYTTTSSSHGHQEQHQDAMQAADTPSRLGSTARALLILLVLLAIAGGIGWLIAVAMR
jgi:hypothetical protein